jgi:hypothetical protein
VPTAPIKNRWHRFWPSAPWRFPYWYFPSWITRLLTRIRFKGWCQELRIHYTVGCQTSSSIEHCLRSGTYMFQLSVQRLNFLVHAWWEYTIRRVETPSF